MKAQDFERGYGRVNIDIEKGLILDWVKTNVFVKDPSIGARNTLNNLPADFKGDSQHIYPIYVVNLQR